MLLFLPYVEAIKHGVLWNESTEKITFTEKKKLYQTSTCICTMHTLKVTVNEYFWNDVGSRLKFFTSKMALTFEGWNQEGLHLEPGYQSSHQLVLKRLEYAELFEKKKVHSV